MTHGDRSPFFVNAPELAEAAKNKISRSLYAAVVRIAIQAQDPARTVQVACDLAASLRVFAHPHGNELIPLENVEYPFEQHVEDALRRQSRRPGMLLNSDELVGFVHLPSSAVRSPILLREIGKTKAAPAIVQGGNGIVLGQNIDAGRSVEVRLTAEQRVRHTHIVGASGTGKSTLLFHAIQQDIENGEGIGVLDPHGDLIERILGSIPPHRVTDVVVVDPSDEEFSVGFNILSAHSDFEKTLLASDLVSVFQRLSTSWGDQMGSVLQNAILAFLENDRGGTLADLRRFLLDVPFRNEFLKTVRDPDVVFYWKRTFPQLTGNKSIGPVLTRLETFLSPKPIRYMVSQPVNRLDFADILDTGKIFLAKLPQGQMGKENAFLLGSLLVAKFQQLAMSRQRVTQQERRDFFLYIDEFQHFITPSMTEIPSGARKYRLGLVLAHQELRQLQRDPEVAGAVLSNPFTRIVFRVGDDDARKLAEGFAHFDSRDLQSLSTGHAIARVERSDFDFNLTVPFPEEPDADAAARTREQVITSSRKKYATPRAEIETTLMRQLEVVEATPPPPKSPKPVSEPMVAEVPKPAVSETRSDLVVPPAATVSETVTKVKPTAHVKPAFETVRKPVPPADLGMGGAQHKAIQQRIKRAAEGLGFRVTIEKEIAGGSVDLVLEKGGQSIACEITVTTTTDHEVGNIAKCLKAGFTRVVIVCQEERRLRKIQNAVVTSLGTDVVVGFFKPDEFLAELRNQAQAPPSEGSVVRRGYKIKHQFPQMTEEERRIREAAAMKLIAETMRGSEPVPFLT